MLQIIRLNTYKGEIVASLNFLILFLLKSKGNHSLEIETQDLPLGLHTLLVKTNSGAINKKFTVLR